MTAIDDLTRLIHIREAAQETLEFMVGESLDSLKSNRMLLMAVVKELEIIGEAANNISPQCQLKYSYVPWRQIIGMRNRLVHVYFGIDIDIVWETIKTKLPNLIQEIEVIIEDIKTENKS